MASMTPNDFDRVSLPYVLRPARVVSEVAAGKTGQGSLDPTEDAKSGFVPAFVLGQTPSAALVPAEITFFGLAACPSTLY